MVDSSIRKSPIDTRRKLYSNIVLSGGNCGFKNFFTQIAEGCQKSRRNVSNEGMNHFIIIICRIQSYVYLWTRIAWLLTKKSYILHISRKVVYHHLELRQDHIIKLPPRKILWSMWLRIMQKHLPCGLVDQSWHHLTDFSILATPRPNTKKKVLVFSGRMLLSKQNSKPDKSCKAVLQHRTITL